MKFKFIKCFISAILSVVIICGTVSFAAASYGAENAADVWSEALYTERARLYGDKKVYTAWPGAKSDHTNSILAALSYENCLTVSQVFGEENIDLLLNDIESTRNYKDYFTDADRLLKISDITLWNGFVFVAAYGNLAGQKSVTETFTYGSGKTVTENVATRTDASGRESFLYVFDISEGKNYGEARVAKWNLADIAPQRNALSIIESVAVDDNYIALTVNFGNASENGRANAYDRGLVILENNINRSGSEIAPLRADTAADDYVFGQRVIAEAEEKSEIKTERYFESTIIGGYHILIPQSGFEIAKSGSRLYKDEERIILTDIRNTESYGIGARRAMHVSEMYENDKESIGISLDELLPCEGGSWYNTEEAFVKGVKINKTELTFLVSYRADGKLYNRIYITDWSDPINPKYVTDFKYETSDNNGSIYYYEGYYYIAGTYGIDVLKKFDFGGALNIKFVASYKYTGEDWGTDKKVGVFVSGNYMTVWNDVNTNDGYEGRMLLSSDKTEIREFLGYGTRNRSFSQNNCNDIIVFNDRMYMIAAQQLFESMPSAVAVTDMSRAAKVSIEILPMPKTVSVPYTVSGTVFGAEYVNIYIDGVFKEKVKAKINPDKTYGFSYNLTESGKHSIKAVAAIGNAELEKAADFAEVTAISANDTEIIGSYEQNGKTLTAAASISNRGTEEITMRLIIGVYKDAALYGVSVSESFLLHSGETKTIDNIKIELPYRMQDITVKGFLTNSSGGFAAIGNAVEFTN